MPPPSLKNFTSSAFRLLIASESGVELRSFRSPSKPPSQGAPTAQVVKSEAMMIAFQRPAVSGTPRNSALRGHQTVC
jgi:hypothetical protein